MNITTPEAAGDRSQPQTYTEPEPIRAVKLKHPGRIIFAVILAAIAIVIVWDAALHRPNYEWDVVGQYLFDARIMSGVWYTLQLTVFSMIIAIVLGVLLAIMRLSPNPVVKSVAWVYLWFFRGTPIYVQLAFWGLFATIYPTIGIGIPGMPPWVSAQTDVLMSAFVLAIVGLALNEAAYMAEIVRAGLLSVDKGQDEAAIALGLGWWHTISRVVLPQAMRVIIPPTGNEIISMLKTTSLVNAIPFTLELFMRQKSIAAVTYKPVPMLVVASIWYLVITSILMVGQYYLEKHFSKGHGERQEVMKPSIATHSVGVIGTDEGRGTDDDADGTMMPPQGRPGGGA